MSSFSSTSSSSSRASQARISRTRVSQTECAALLRARPELSEVMLWKELSASKLGVRFQRQAVIGPAIVDFLAPSIRLVIEVDGRSHLGKQRPDARRDAALARAGYRVLRFTADAVEKRLPEVLAAIQCAMREAQGPVSL